MNIVDAIERAKGGAFITNYYYAQEKRYLSYIGNGNFFVCEYNSIMRKPLEKLTINSFYLNDILTNTWEVINPVLRFE